jgi:hypothetical protein
MACRTGMPEWSPTHDDVPRGWRLVTDHNEKPHPQAMIFGQQDKWRPRYDQNVKTPYTSTDLYIVPIEDSVQAGELAVNSPTILKEEQRMLSDKEKQDIIAIVSEYHRQSAVARPGVAAKSLSLAGRGARRAVKWAIAPAKPVGWLAAKLLQYALFAGVVGSAGAGGYWAWNNAKSYLPTIQWKQEKQVEEVTVDPETHKFNTFVTTGIYL